MTLLSVVIARSPALISSDRPWPPHELSSDHGCRLTVRLPRNIDPRQHSSLTLSWPYNSVTKLAGLFIKTLAKPLSKRIKHECSRYQTTQRLLVGIGQTSHSLTSRLTIWSAGYKVRSIKPLDDEAALKLGAEFIGEGFLLTVSAGWLLYEWNSANEKAAAKAEEQRAAAKAERADLGRKLHAIDVRLQALEDYVKQNSASILAAGEYRPPDQKEIVSLEVDDESTSKTEAKSATTTTPPEITMTDNGKLGKSIWWRWPPW